MSGITHSHTPIKQRLLRDQRRAKIAALAAVALLTAAIVALVLALDAGDSATSVEKHAAQPGVRYEGGPEEGTAALTERSPVATFDPNSIKNPPGQRYDGGPEEGTRGAGH
jgi:uncharacterized membrane protein